MTRGPTKVASSTRIASTTNSSTSVNPDSLSRTTRPRRHFIRPTVPFDFPPAIERYSPELDRCTFLETSCIAFDVSSMPTLANELDHNQPGSARKALAIANAILVLAAIISASASFYFLGGLILALSLVLSSMMLAIARIEVEQ